MSAVAKTPRKQKAGKAAKPAKAIASTQSLSAFVKGICDVMRRSNCASALQYVPELTWILFLRILDAQEARDAEQAEALGAKFSPALHSPYRWQDWAAPWSDKPGHPRTSDGKPQGWKRHELFAGGGGKFLHRQEWDPLVVFHDEPTDEALLGGQFLAILRSPREKAFDQGKPSFQKMK